MSGIISNFGESSGEAVGVGKNSRYYGLSVRSEGPYSCL